MAQEPNNPHDALVKALLESPERAGVLLRENLPATVTRKLAAADPEPLAGSFIDPELRESFSDRLFQARLIDGRPVYLYVLIEHKSEPDPGTPVQLVGYMQRIWQRYAEQDGQGRAWRYRHLPPIIPLVLYNGRLEWSVPLSLMACIDADDELLALQRDFGYEVRHLRPHEAGGYSADPVVRTVLRSLAWAFAETLTWADLERLLRELPSGHPLERAILRYIVRVFPTTETDLTRALEETWPERAQELAMTVAEEWLARGEEKGKKAGKKEGRKEGKKEGEAQTLLRQIERKFGTEAKGAYQQRIENASLEDLEVWIDRILDAESVEAVFGDE